jgi:hypothetical protein
MKKNLNNIIVFQGKNYFGRTVHFHNKETNIDKKLLMFEETLKNAMEPYLLSDELTDEEVNTYNGIFCFVPKDILIQDDDRVIEWCIENGIDL